MIFYCLLTTVVLCQTMPAAEYQLRFQGNSFFSAGQLRQAAEEELANFDRLGYRQAEADDAAFQMTLAYKKAGFAFATVNYLYQFDQENKQLSFQVDEGPRVRIHHIAFTGNTYFNDSRLLPFFQNPQNQMIGNGTLYYVEAAVRTALDDMRNLYFWEGFTDIRIGKEQVQFSPDRENVSLTVDIAEGRRYIIRDVKLQGDLLPAVREELNSLVAEFIGKSSYSRRKQQLSSSIIAIYGNQGYPDVQVTFVDMTDGQPNDVVLTATIAAGPRVTISDISITGQQKTKEAYIRNRLKLHTGDFYSQEKKQQSFQDLYASGLFSRVTINLVPTTAEDERSLAVKVEEADSRELSFGAGWGSYELLRFNIGFKDRNFLGTGRIIRTEEHLSLKSKSALVGFTDPWFLNTDITADLPFSYSQRQEPSFDQEDISSSLFFSKKMSSSLLITLGYSFRRTSITSIDPNITLENTDTDYNLASLKLQASWDTRNDPFFPSAGYKNFVAVEAADAIILSQIGLLRLTAGSRYFKSISRNNILGLRYSTGLIIPGRNQITLPLAERFFNGGENTVRSFKESQIGPLDLDGEPVGGMAINVASLEIRHRFSPHFAATLFFDAGNISPNRSLAEEEQTSYTSGRELLDITLREFFRDFRYAVGVGVQYLTPVGPLRLDVAANPNPKARGDERDFMIHFSMGMAF
jgi:outer membrane protein assembly complex protein YaeT